MAQKTTVELIDDIDGGKADESVPFALDGKHYVIDLSKKNATAFRKALDKYTKAARLDPVGQRQRTSNGGGRTPSGRTGYTLDYPLAEVRAWAKSKKIKVSDRGRMPKDVVDRWRKETGK